MSFSRGQLVAPFLVILWLLFLYNTRTGENKTMNIYISTVRITIDGSYDTDLPLLSRGVTPQDADNALLPTLIHCEASYCNKLRPNKWEDTLTGVTYTILETREVEPGDVETLLKYL